MLQRRSRKRRPDRAGHRSGDAVLNSPRVVLDADGEYLYIPADRALQARAERLAAQAEVTAASAVEVAAVEPAVEVVVAEPVVEAAAVEAVVEAAAVEAGAGVTAVKPTVDVAAIESAVQVAAAKPAAVEAVAPPVSTRHTWIPASDPIPAPDPFPPARHRPAPRLPLPESESPSDLEIAIGLARVAARRRARIMALLFVATVASWSVAAASSAPVWVAVPATVLLVMHVLACRIAGLRSRETLMMLAVQVHSAEVQTRPQRQFAADGAEADEPRRTPDRVARRAAAVGAETWEPIPVPPPTYTLKPAVHRPENAPLDLPASAKGEGPVSRGALPRRAADIERILALESHLDELFEEPKVVNG